MQVVSNAIASTEKVPQIGGNPWNLILVKANYSEFQHLCHQASSAAGLTQPQLVLLLTLVHLVGALGAGGINIVCMRHTHTLHLYPVATSLLCAICERIWEKGYFRAFTKSSISNAYNFQTTVAADLKLAVCIQHLATLAENYKPRPLPV